MPSKLINFLGRAARKRRMLRALVAAVALLPAALVAGSWIGIPGTARGASTHAALPPRSSGEETAAIRQVLDDQAAAWNRGDLEGFAEGYWKSEATAFAGTQGILRGWPALVERYRRSYPDRKAMGTLNFSGLEITPLCADAALVLGHWHLERDAGPIGGVFSLVLRRLPEGWRIIADHTSVVPAAEAVKGK